MGALSGIKAANKHLRIPIKPEGREKFRKGMVGRVGVRSTDFEFFFLTNLKYFLKENHYF